MGALKWDEGYREGLRAKGSDEWGQRGRRSQEGEGQRDRDTRQMLPKKVAEEMKAPRIRKKMVACWCSLDVNVTA